MNIKTLDTAKRDLKLRTHLLGEQTAENDRMLLGNFIETPEYRTLIENPDSTVVVGRRGTGKSALFTKLGNFWESQHGNTVIKISPEDFHTIGFRSIFTIISGKYAYVRAASKLLWKYALLMETAVALQKNYKARQAIVQFPQLLEHSKQWALKQTDFFSKMTECGNTNFRQNQSVELMISTLGISLNLQTIESEFKEFLESVPTLVYILIDRLDEGYEDDTTGTALVAGAILAASELNKKFDKFRPILFQRDSIHRSIAKNDPDYTRNIEGEVLRLHWDTHQLLSLVARRLNFAFSLKMENAQRIWDRCTANQGSDRELQGESGFKKCLQFTLYRPRDLMSLLNQAFYNAMKEGRNNIVYSDIESTAKGISEARLDDLRKEYYSIMPSIVPAVQLFTNISPEISFKNALDLVDTLLLSGESPWSDAPEILIDCSLLGREGIIRSLYSIGFLGIHDVATNAFIFCHDGRNPDREFNSKDRLLVHPCYWIALNATKNALTPSEAEQINDEYEITVTSVAPEIRNKKIGGLISAIGKIAPGQDDAAAFEDWALTAVQTVFAGHLENIEAKPNKDAIQRRDIVGTNLSKSTAWDRIRIDYGVRQVIFEVKNYSDIGPTEYRQMASYLVGNYGCLGFIITRDEDDSPRAGKDLDWLREIHTTQDKVVVKLSFKFFTRLLGKLRNPEKHDSVNLALNQLIDNYERRYLNLTVNRSASKKSRRRKQ